MLRPVIRWSRRLALAGCLVLLLSIPSVADPLYTITDMGRAIGQVEISGINDSGQVAGDGRVAVSGGYGYFGFLYNSWGTNAGLIQNIGGLGTTADAINNSGQVVLNAAYPDNGGSAWVLNLSDGTRTPVGTLTGPPQAMTNAAAINDLGQVVGFSGANSSDPSVTWGVYHGFVAQNGSITDLGTLPGGQYSQATAINNVGQIAGYANLGTTNGVMSPEHAFLYSNGVMHDLGTLGGSLSFANGINNSGQVVGYSSLTAGAYVAVTSHAFLYSGGVMHDLGTLGGQNSVANAINNSGQIVGYSQVAPSAADLQSGQQIYHGFLYESGKMIDLNTMISATSGFTITGATAINNLGQIIAYGTSPAGTIDYLLLTPPNLPTPAAVIDPYPGEPVPEPSTLAFIMLAGAGFGLRRLMGRR